MLRGDGKRKTAEEVETPRQLCVLARSANTSDAYLEELCSHDNWHVRAAAATNPNIGARRLTTLAGDALWAVRYHAAASAHLTSDCADHLIQDLNPVRLQLAANPATPAEIVHRLTADVDLYVRGVALGHLSVDVERLSEAAADFVAPAWVLAGIAANSFCPEQLRDEIDTWLVLGGGRGDAQFDPVTGIGDPGDGTEHETIVYERLGAMLPIEVPHSLGRARAKQGPSDKLSKDQAIALLRDPSPLVRLSVLARLGTIPPRELGPYFYDDPVEAVRQQYALVLLNQARKALSKSGDRSSASGPTAGRVAAGVAVGLAVAGTLWGMVSYANRPPEINVADIPTLYQDPLELRPTGTATSTSGVVVSTNATQGAGGLSRLVIETGDDAIEITAVDYRTSDDDTNTAVALASADLPLRVAPNTEQELFPILPANTSNLVVNLLVDEVAETIEIAVPPPDGDSSTGDPQG